MKHSIDAASVAHLDRDGFAIVRTAIDDSTRIRLLDQLGPVDGAGRRGLLQIPAIAEFVRSEVMFRIVRPNLPAAPHAVRAIFFDKTRGQNWGVAWHQDLALALKTPAEVAGFGPWSIKDGVPHALAPAAALEQMLTVRIHLDDCDESNGALRVIPGSHQHGRLDAARIPNLREAFGEITCAVLAGDALLMRPLLVHSSNRSASPGHRRVLHIEYAGFTLPSELQWHEAA